MRTTEEIRQFAIAAHRGQTDMIGDPAIQHVLTVGRMGRNELEQKAGYLHDVVEDTDITLNDLRSKGVEEEVLAAVDLLTHRDGVSYEDYVRHIVASGNQTAIHVKLNDLRQNLDRAERSLQRLGATGDRALAAEIRRIARRHGRAERYIRRAIAPRRSGTLDSFFGLLKLSMAGYFVYHFVIFLSL